MHGDEILGTVERGIQSGVDLIVRYLQTLWLAIFRPKRFQRAMRADRHYTILVRAELFMVMTALLSQAAVASWELAYEADSGSGIGREMLKRLAETYVRPPSFEEFVRVGLPVLVLLLVLGRLVPLLIVHRPSMRRVAAKAFYYATGAGMVSIHPILVLGLIPVALVVNVNTSDINMKEALVTIVALLAIIAAVIAVPAWVAGVTLKTSPRFRELRWPTTKIAFIAMLAAFSPLLSVGYRVAANYVERTSIVDGLRATVSVQGDKPDNPAKAPVKLLVALRNTSEAPCFLLTSRGASLAEPTEGVEANKKAKSDENKKEVTPEPPVTLRFDAGASGPPPIWEIKPGATIMFGVTLDLTKSKDLAGAGAGFGEWWVGTDAEKNPTDKKLALHLTFWDAKFNEFKPEIELSPPH